MSGDGDFRFSGYHPVISCEGTAEKVAVDILLEADVLVFPKADVVDVTRLRKASDIHRDSRFALNACCCVLATLCLKVVF